VSECVVYDGIALLSVYCGTPEILWHVLRRHVNNYWQWHWN